MQHVNKKNARFYSKLIFKIENRFLWFLLTCCTLKYMYNWRNCDRDTAVRVMWHTGKWNVFYCHDCYVMGTCVTHVPWCMSGSLTRGGGEKCSRHSWRMRNLQFCVSGKRPMWMKNMTRAFYIIRMSYWIPKKDAVFRTVTDISLTTSI